MLPSLVKRGPLLGGAWSWRRASSSRGALALSRCLASSVIDRGDTIFALSSAPGKAGVAVVRMSGPKTRAVLRMLCKGAEPPPHRTTSLRGLYHPTTRALMDKGLVLYFEGPNSFTGEDCGELHVHGGRAVIDCILQGISEAGVAMKADNNEEGRRDVRMAEAGEFSMRALLNGKMDLTSIEGVGDLINAETEQQRLQAVEQMNGRLEELYEGWRRQILSALASVEAFIDFGDDADLGDMERHLENIADSLECTVSAMERHLNDGRRGELLREGISVSITGPPNAGKSSLLNMLCDRQAAIVSEIPGTTRDVIEVAVDVGGFPVRLADTAGVREKASDAVEEEGIRRALQRSEDSNVRVSMVDAQALKNGCPSTRAFLLKLKERHCQESDLILVNKIDLLSGIEERKGILSAMEEPMGAPLQLSTKTGEGFASFLTELTASLTRVTSAGEIAQGESVRLTRQRHRENVGECVKHLRDYMLCRQEIDIAAEELRQAANALGRITGRVGVEDMLDVLFKDFCIGK